MKFNFFMKIMLITFIPIIGISLFLTVFNLSGLTKTSNKLLEQELNNTGITILQNYESLNNDNYDYKDGILTKGNIKISEDLKYVDTIKEKTGLYVTIFYNDTRILTNIMDDNGKRLTGTKADQKVVDAVLKNGETFYISNITIGNVECAANYIPIKQPSDGQVIGMIFVGKDRAVANNMISKLNTISFVSGIVIILIFSVCAAIAIKHIVKIVKYSSENLNKVKEGEILQ